MKKFFLALVAIVAFGFAANAQDAIGIRFGGGHGYGAELSYQKGMGANRLEFDLGISQYSGENDFNLAGVYHWSFPIVDNFNWYVGPGLNLDYCSNHGFGLGVCGQIGIEYNFSSIPFQISLDARPTYKLLVPEKCGLGGFGWGACLAVRYKL